MPVDSKNINDENYSISGDNVYKNKQEFNKERFYEFLNNLDLSSILNNLNLNNIDLNNIDLNNLDLNKMNLRNFNIKNEPVDGINSKKQKPNRSNLNNMNQNNMNLNNLDLSSISSMMDSLQFINKLGNIFSTLNAMDQPVYSRYRDKRIDLLSAFKPLVGQPQAQMIDTVIHLYTITKILKY